VNKTFDIIDIHGMYVKNTLKSLTFISDIPIYTAIGSIMSVVICPITLKQKLVEGRGEEVREVK
jgi:hypothetical protein